jgi:MFS family permease
MGILSSLWGIAGVMLLLGSAVYRLTPLAMDAFSHEMLWYHWAFFLVVLLFMAYAEGYRAFQQGFSPRVAARARYLRTHRNALHSLLAPLFCMGYFHAPKRRRVTSISVTAGIIVLIVLVRLLPQPWRGLVDAGVVVGLAWGIVSLLVFAIQALTMKEFKYSPEVPEEKKSQVSELP